MLRIAWDASPRICATNPTPQASCSVAGSYIPLVSCVRWFSVTASNPVSTPAFSRCSTIFRRQCRHTCQRRQESKCIIFENDAQLHIFSIVASGLLITNRLRNCGSDSSTKRLQMCRMAFAITGSLFAIRSANG
jgi:hypothetical protein